MTTTTIRTCDVCLKSYAKPVGGWVLCQDEDSGRTYDQCRGCTARAKGYKAPDWSNPLIAGTGRRLREVG